MAISKYVGVIGTCLLVFLSMHFASHSTKTILDLLKTSNTAETSTSTIGGGHNETHNITGNYSEIENIKISRIPGNESTEYSATLNESLPVEPPPPLSIVVQLSGELGNNLDKFAHGICLKEWLMDEFQQQSNLIIRHQNVGKWVNGFHNARRCFPWTRQFDWRAGNTPAIDRVLKNPNDDADHTEWWNSVQGVNSDNETVVHYALQQAVRMYKGRPVNNRTIDLGVNLTVPWLYASSFVHYHVCMDRYYDIIVDRLRFDTAACCKQIPEPDESVFHFRNFLGELVKRGKAMGYEELNPNSTAQEIFANLPMNGTGKVAITARARDVSAASPYVQALKYHRNATARVITGQSDVHDFCFLASAQQELVGTARSTFCIWAGFLGNTSTVRLYSVNSTATRRAGAHAHGYNFTHPRLKERFRFEIYDQ